eukprot:2211456-Pyramimonas_sp.AAC.1
MEGDGRADDVARQAWNRSPCFTAKPGSCRKGNHNMNKRLTLGRGIWHEEKLESAGDRIAKLPLGHRRGREAGCA